MVLKRSVRSLISILGSPLLRRLKNLEDIHFGEECYIFGDGSSVNYFDISCFNDRIGIAVNAFPRHIDCGLTDVRYWIVAEPGFFLPPLLKSTTNPVSGYQNRKEFQAFFRRQEDDRADLTRLTSIINFLGEIDRQTYFFWDHLPRRRDKERFRSERGSFAGSICAALTIAEYLGFKHAYLIGIDNTHNPGTSHHWYESIDPISSPQIVGTYHAEFFSEIQKHIGITTITPTKQLTELPSIDYETFTGKPLSFRNNYDLLSPTNLKRLQMNPRYII